MLKRLSEEITRRIYAHRLLETAHLGFRLSAPQPGERVARNRGAAELGADLSKRLVHRRHCLARHIGVIGKKRSDDVDRT